MVLGDSSLLLAGVAMESLVRLIHQSIGLNWPGEGSLPIGPDDLQEKSRQFSGILLVFLGWASLGSAVSANDMVKLNEGALNPRRHALAAERDEQRRAQVTCDWRPPDGQRAARRRLF
jgi:hypothetical protein